MMKFKQILVLSLVLGFGGLIVTTGCMNRPATAQIVPGVVNQFDSDTYLALVTSKGVIDQTKVDLTNNTFPANWVSNIKTTVNDLVIAYNTADTAYTAYHIALLAGTATLEQQQAVQSTVDTMNQKVVAVSSAKVGQ
jgi:hypothetical protein